AASRAGRQPLVPAPRAGATSVLPGPRRIDARARRALALSFPWHVPGARRRRGAPSRSPGPPPRTARRGGDDRRRHGPLARGASLVRIRGGIRALLFAARRADPHRRVPPAQPGVPAVGPVLS